VKHSVRREEAKGERHRERERDAETDSGNLLRIGNVAKGIGVL